ncbi:MAG TPA: ATP-binding cassette domain-containing protein, partial [Bacteroidales bacterium]|nr:ATP-binding cassette domain-containing protein [Bacteroidales bacterium]
YEGEVKFGHQVSVGYYAQNQHDMLDMEKTVFQTLDDVATGDIRTRIKGILGAFLFSGDAIDKKVKVLSGGEKARLSLARMLLFPTNLLILDEPTNHLDMQSKDILKNALLQFDGTLIIVSHDRDFLQGLTTKVIEFRKPRIKEYLGDVYDFLKERQLVQLQELNQTVAELPKSEQLSESSPTKQKWERKKSIEKEKRKLEKEVERVEQEIEKSEQKIKNMDQLLADPAQYQLDVFNQDWYRSYNELKEKSLHLMSAWENLHDQLAETTAELDKLLNE